MIKTKTVRTKLLYIIATLAALAMLIPAAIPVSAADGAYLEMQLMIDGVPSGYPDGGHDITGSQVKVVVMDLPGGTVSDWRVTPYQSQATIDVEVTGPVATAYCLVSGGYGEATIWADVVDAAGVPSTLEIDKKWGQLAYTDIYPRSQSIPMTWNESEKVWWGSTWISDYVYGDFINKDDEPVVPAPPIEGIILNFYLKAGWEHPPAEVDTDFDALTSYVEGMDDALFARFAGDGTYARVVTDASGYVELPIESSGEEAIWVIIIPEYPASDLQVDVAPEVASINFWTYESEKVPQVRWAGEKIVLEKFFGTGERPNERYPEYGPPTLPWPGTIVCFTLENQSPGSLESIGQTLESDSQRVWTMIDEQGFARIMFVSEAPGEIDIDLAVYNYNYFVQPDPYPYEWDDIVINQHGFVLFYLKLEEVTLGNVDGKRAGHFCGPWIPPNPWDTATDIPSDPYDYLPGENVDTLNVSQDALLRARVKGWFMGDNLSNRPARVVDSNGNGIIDVSDTKLPEGRWVLPDDWPYLAGPDWVENRLHWDIWDNPFDDVIAYSPLGDYFCDLNHDLDWDDPPEPLVAVSPVYAPFRPGVEIPTWFGYDPFIKLIYDAPMKTVVPNGVLEWWDAPMPPAKITFKLLDPDKTPNANDSYRIRPGALDDQGISDHAGFFKEALKPEIYYLMDGDTPVFTNPAYCALIPAFEDIPAFVDNGGYDWDTWNAPYGPYGFWWFLNRPIDELDKSGAAVISVAPDAFPTKVQVYTDNHGEAMVYLNGDFDLNLWPWFYETDTIDIPWGEKVATSTVVAIADYPYFRKHTPLMSNPVEKDWLWGGEIRGTDIYYDISPVETHMILAVGEGLPPPPETVAQSNKLMVFLWITDRDNLPFGVMDAMIEWEIEGSGSVVDISGKSGQGLSDYNDVTANIWLSNGFLAGTGGSITPATHEEMGVSGVKTVVFDPDNPDNLMYTDPEAMLFHKFWPDLDPNAYVVAGVELFTSNLSAAPRIHAQITSADFAVYPGLLGELDRYISVDFGVVHELDDIPLYGDANIDGIVNMGDVTAVERTILGLMEGYVGADANGDNSIDMGDVVKIERMILGLD